MDERQQIILHKLKQKLTTVGFADLLSKAQAFDDGLWDILERLTEPLDESQKIELVRQVSAKLALATKTVERDMLDCQRLIHQLQPNQPKNAQRSS